MSNVGTVIKTVLGGFGLLCSMAYGFKLGQESGREKAENEARDKKLDELLNNQKVEE